MKKIIGLALMLLTVFVFTSCGKNLELKDKAITHETKFGGIYIMMTIDDFNNEGFKFGDSVDISFTNGYELKDLPYYNGYYTDTGEPLLVGYPGYPYIRAGINNGDDLFNVAEVTENDKATIKLNKAGKYLDIQEALDIHYTDIQGDMSDVKFGNFRVCNVGNLKDNILYRSASPVDNQHNRASVVDRLINNKVNTILNLSDNDSELAEHFTKTDFNSPYAKSLYDNGKIIALSMNMNFRLSSGEEDKAPKLYTEFKDNTFSGKLIQGLRFALNNDGPYLVHCVEGKDRTGFVIMIFEALANATYDEIVNDYMITYDNYYDINLESDSSKYNVIKSKNIDVMLKTVINDDSVDIRTANYGYYVEQYLISKGMNQTEITALKNKLCK